MEATSEDTQPEFHNREEATSEDTQPVVHNRQSRHHESQEEDVIRGGMLKELIFTVFKNFGKEVIKDVITNEFVSEIIHETFH